MILIALRVQQIAQSLQSMMEYDGEAKDFEETFMATFQVSYSDMFDTLHTHDLKEGGDKIPVTMDNCQVSSNCLLPRGLVGRGEGEFYAQCQLV